MSELAAFRQEVAVATLPRPDLINPFELSIAEHLDLSYVADLGLDKLLDGMPFLGSETRDLSYLVLTGLNADAPTVAYRQAIFADLIEAPARRAELRRGVRSLQIIDRKSREFEWGQNLQTGLQLLRAYRKFIEQPMRIEDSASDALRQLAAYVAAIAESREFQGIRDFIAKVENLGGVALHVSLDKEALPERMSTLRLLPDPGFLASVTPELQEILGEQGYSALPEASGRSASLREPWGLTELGQLIQEFVSRQFVAAVGVFNAQIKEVTGLLAPIDFYAGVAEFLSGLAERGWAICQPRLLAKEARRAAVVGACNPLLAGREPERPPVPNDINYSAERNMFVVTGANNGGKTTFVKTVGLLQVMAQKGLFIPARAAQISFADAVFTHFVAPDDITRGEGRYRNELRRIRQILERATPYSLVILDEPCGGTDHAEGQRQSLVLLRGFHTLGATTYFTTHMHEVAAAVAEGAYPCAQNLQVECRRDQGGLVYSYRILPGAAGRSFGEEIAREMGLYDDEILGVVQANAARAGFTDLLRGS